MHLNEIKNIEDFSKELSLATVPDIGFFGGRKVTFGGESVSLSALEEKLKEFKPINQLYDASYHIILDLNNAAETKLQNKWIITRIFTWFRRGFGFKAFNVERFKQLQMTLKLPEDLFDNIQTQSIKLKERAEVMSSVLKLDFSFIDPGTLQHLVVICHKLEDHGDLAIEIKKLMPKEDPNQEVLSDLLVGLNKTKSELQEKLDEHKDKLNTAIEHELSKVTEELLPHQAMLLQEINKPYGILSKFVSEDVKKRAENIKERVPDDIVLEKNSKENISLDVPQKFRNLGNSCYINSTVQTLLALPYYKDLIEKPLAQEENEPKEHFEHRNKIQAILKILVKTTGSDAIAEVLLDLRKAIFDSGFNLDLDLDVIDRQQDAGQLGLVLTTVLGAQTMIKETLEFTIEGQLLRGSQKQENPSGEFLLKFKDRNNLQVMIGSQIHDTDNESAIIYVDGIEYFAPSYTNIKTFLNPQDAIIVRLSRFNTVYNSSSKQWNTIKIPDPVEIPDDFILDFSDASSSPPLKYQIKGFVIHIGVSAHSGHYISYVKKGTHWYKCNDSTITEVKDMAEIRMKAKEGYMFTMEKL